MFGNPQFIGIPIKMPQPDVCRSGGKRHPLIALLKQFLGTLYPAPLNQQGAQNCRLQAEDGKCRKNGAGDSADKSAATWAGTKVLPSPSAKTVKRITIASLGTFDSSAMSSEYGSSNRNVVSNLRPRSSIILRAVGCQRRSVSPLPATTNRRRASGWSRSASVSVFARSNAVMIPVISGGGRNAA